MGKGEGAGEGSGDGQGAGAGEGQGAGAGADRETNVVAGSAVAVGLTVCMCVVGFPMMIAGGVLMSPLLNLFTNTYEVGLALLTISVLMLVGGIVLIILICTGVCGKKNKTQPTPMTVTVIPTGPHGQAQAGYPPQGQAPMGYPPQGQAPMGYPPQGPPPAYNQAYPPGAVQPAAGDVNPYPANNDVSYPPAAQPAQPAPVHSAEAHVGHRMVQAKY